MSSGEAPVPISEVEVRVAFGADPDDPPDEVLILTVGELMAPDSEVWDERPYLEALRELHDKGRAEAPVPHRTPVTREHYS